MSLRRLQHSFALTLLLTLVGAILAACGGTTATPSGGTTAVTQATTAATSSGAATAAATTETMAAMTTTAATSGTTAATAEATTAATTEATSAAATETAATGTTAAGGGASTPLTGNILHVGASTFPDNLDPQAESFSNEIPYTQLAFEGLTRLDKDLKTIPGAAEKWEYNKDATAITFTLRSGLKYSDGSPLTAADFQRAVYRLNDPRNPGDYQTALSMLKGSDALLAAAVPTDTAKIPTLRKALGVKAIDETHISFQFTQPTPYFHTIASTWLFFPSKVDWGDAKGDTWWQKAANMVGNGPFMFTNIDTQGELLEYKLNPNYWGTKRSIDGVQVRFIKDASVALQAYKNGEVDIITPDVNELPGIKADPDQSKEYAESVGACTTVMEFNLNKKPFDNKQVREAFNYAFNRDAYIQDVLKGAGVKTLTWIPPGFPGYDASEKRYDFDVAKAKATLAAAGFPGGKGLPEIKYQYNGSNPANQARAEYLIQMFQKNLGVKIIPDPVEGKVLINLRKKNATHPLINIGGWCSDYPDPQDWLSVVWNSSQQFAQVLGYKNPKFDDLTNKGDAEPDPTKRAQLYDQAQKMLIGDAAQVVIYNSKNYYLIKPTAKGFIQTSQDSEFPGSTTALEGVTVAKQP